MQILFTHFIGTIPTLENQVRSWHPLGMKPQVLWPGHVATDIIIGTAVLTPIELPATGRKSLVKLFFRFDLLAAAKLPFGLLQHTSRFQLQLNLVKIVSTFGLFEGELNLVQPLLFFLRILQTAGVMITRAVGFAIKFEIMLGVLLRCCFAIKLNSYSNRWRLIVILHLDRVCAPFEDMQIRQQQITEDTEPLWVGLTLAFCGDMLQTLR